MTNRAYAQLIAGALVAAADVAKQRNRQNHALALAQLKAGALRDMAEALITRRVEAVQSGFETILGQFGEQARHLMAQQSEWSRARLETTDPLLRIELSQRLTDIDTQLGNIRADAALLYARMTEVILLLGGRSFDCGGELGLTLSLPSMGRSS